MSCLEIHKSISYRFLDFQSSVGLKEDFDTQSFIKTVTSKIKDFDKENLILVEIREEIKDPLVLSISELYFIKDLPATEKRVKERKGLMDLAVQPFGLFRLELKRRYNKKDLEKIVKAHFVSRKLIIEIFNEIKPHLFIEIHSTNNSFATVEIDPYWSIKTTYNHLRLVK